MDNTKITVATTVAADTAKVWTYFTAPEHITQWNFATPEWHCPSANNDLRAGGHYTARMEARDGSFGFDFTAVYDEVIDGKKLSYTTTDGRTATTHFEQTGNSTRVTTTFEADAENDVALQQAGWQAILENFKNYTEAN